MSARNTAVDDAAFADCRANHCGERPILQQLHHADLVTQKSVVWTGGLSRVLHGPDPGTTQCDEPEQQHAPINWHRHDACIHPFCDAARMLELSAKVVAVAQRRMADEHTLPAA
jgi:hypothetical protein